MKHVIDPREASQCDNHIVAVTTVSAVPVLVLARNPNRISLSVTLDTTLAAGADQCVHFQVQRGPLFFDIAIASQNNRTVLLRLEDYGQIIQEDIFVFSVPDGLAAHVVDTCLIHRGV